MKKFQEIPQAERSTKATRYFPTRLTALFTFVNLALAVSLSAQPTLPYRNPALPIESRIQDLLTRMTVEEKFRQLFMVTGDLGANPDQFKEGIFGFQVNTVTASEGATEQMMQYNPGANARQTAEKINAIQKYFVENTRLGIPIIAFDEALHGLVRTGATAFPQAIGLAASWDTALVYEVAQAIALECKVRGIRQILSPVVNLATDVRWGRVEETYGEDPLLASRMGVAFVSAFEQAGIVTTPKHFAVNHGEGGRDSYPIEYNERLLEDTYFVPFKACVQEGGARSIMTAYNSIDGRPCTASDWLLNEKLKNEWGFDGFVISDAGATGGANVLHFTATDYEDAGKQAVENGLDVLFQTGFDSYPLFKKPFLDGQVNAAKLDSAVVRVLRAKFQLGLFEQPYVSMDALNGVSDLTAHRKLAKEAALKSAVLLKNDRDRVLPLSKNMKRLAVIGVDAVEARLGGYSGPGNQKTSILDGLKQLAGKVLAVDYAPGCGRTEKTWNIVPGEVLFAETNGKRVAGLQGEYFNNIALSGKPTLVRTDEKIDFRWTLFGPHPSINYDFFSCRWKGKIQSPETGTFKIGIDGNEGYRLYLNGKLVLDTWGGQSRSVQLADFYFEKGKPVDLLVEYKEPSGNAWFRLIWTIGVRTDSDAKIREAIQLAEKSDVVIVVAGIEEGEFADRSHLHLPGRQEEMILQLAATGKPVVVVLVGGSAITMGRWLDQVNAVLQVWYPGEAGGEAVAELLLGQANPSGKLPVTFPHHEGQLPLVYNHKPTGRGDDYADGTGQALFPFGYGLSYTQFEYSDCRLSQPTISDSESVEVRFRIKNTGAYDGTEVAQLYLRDEVASVARPIKALKAFQRVSLKAGEAQECVFVITPAMLSMLDERMKTVIEPGVFRLMIGSSSKDIRLRELLEVKME